MLLGYVIRYKSTYVFDYYNPLINEDISLYVLVHNDLQTYLTIDSVAVLL